jgi:hypothetical protein
MLTGSAPRNSGDTFRSQAELQQWVILAMIETLLIVLM